MAMTQDEVFTKIRTVLVDALGVDDDEVTPGAKLVGDLGAESIDFLDIVFRLEKAFGIKINQGELFPDAIFNDPQFTVEGKLTDAGVAEVRRRLPYIDLSSLDNDRAISEFANVFSVNDLVKFVMTKIA
ncbi:MAG: acyl carrier protein [Planctomycetota bacterium]|nr:acyl carrier protein [Planctomycetota bacterium]